MTESSFEEVDGEWFWVGNGGVDITERVLDFVESEFEFNSFLSRMGFNSEQTV